MQHPSGKSDAERWTCLPLERGVVPAAVEDASEAAWREYDACCRALDERLEQLRSRSLVQARHAIHRAAQGRSLDASAAAELGGAPAAAKSSPSVPPSHAAAAPLWPVLQTAEPACAGAGGVRPDEPTVEGVMQLAAERGRICPAPTAWRRLQALLPRAGHERPPEAVAADDWSRTADWAKRQVLREQVEWAREHGGLARVHAFLKALPESGWYHLAVPEWPALDLG